MKQILRKAIALILAVTAVLFPLAQMATLIRTTDSAKLASSIETAKVNSVVIEAAVEKHYDGDGWNFEPRTSDGVHITPQGDGISFFSSFLSKCFSNKQLTINRLSIILIFGILKNIDHSLEKIIFSKFVM